MCILGLKLPKTHPWFRVAIIILLSLQLFGLFLIQDEGSWQRLPFQQLLQALAEEKRQMLNYTRFFYPMYGPVGDSHLSKVGDQWWNLTLCWRIVSCWNTMGEKKHFKVSSYWSAGWDVYGNIFSSDLAVAGSVFPCSSSSAAPAAAAQRQCWASREFLAVVGLSVAAPSAFFRGENSSSLRTSNATKLLPKTDSF